MFELLIIVLLFANAANGLMSGSQERSSEKPLKFITFNNDESNIRLEMVFAIPFLQIPIGRSSGTNIRPTVDINIKSFVVAGLVFFVLFFIIPGLIRVTIPDSPITRGWENSETSRLLERMEKSLEKYGIDSRSCLSEGICHMLERAKGNVNNGQASSWEKIIDGISSNHWISPMLPNHLNTNNCSPSYSCPIMDYNFTNLLPNMIKKIKKFNINLSDFTNLG